MSGLSSKPVQPPRKAVSIPHDAEIIEISPQSPPTEEDLALENQQPESVVPSEPGSSTSEKPVKARVTLKRLTEKAVEVATLKMQAKTAKSELDNRTAEFNKCESSHSKFPNTRQRQTEEKLKALRKYQSSEAMVKKEEDTLEVMASDLLNYTVSLVVEQSLQSTQTQAHAPLEALSERMETSEKARSSLQSTVNSLLKDFAIFQEANEKAQKEASDIQSKMQSSLDDQIAQNKALRADLDSFKKAKDLESANFLYDLANIKATQASEKIETKNAVDMLQQHFDSETAQTKSKFMALGGKVLKLETKSQAPAVNPLAASLSSRIGSLENKSDSLTAQIKDSISQTESTSKKIKAIDELQRGSSLQIKAVEELHKGTSLAVSKHRERLDFIEKREHVTMATVESSIQTSVSSVETRLSSLEAEKQTTSQRMSSLDEQIQKLETAPQQKIEDPAPKVAELTQRLAEVEKMTALANDQMQDSLVSGEYLQKMERLESEIALLRNKVLAEATSQSQPGLDVDFIKDLVFKTIADEAMVDIEALYKICDGIKDDINNLKKSPETNEQPDQWTSIKQTVDRVVQSLVTVPRKEDLPTTETILASVIAALQTTPNAIPHLASLQQHLQALQNTIENHEVRINNVNTGNLANYILERLPSTTQLQSDNIACKDRLRALESDLNLIKSIVQDYGKDIRKVESKNTKNEDAISKLEGKTDANEVTIADRIAPLIVDVESMKTQLVELSENAVADRSRIDAVEQKVAVQPQPQTQSLVEEQKLSDLGAQVASLSKDKLVMKRLEADIAAVQQQLSTAQTLINKIPTVQRNGEAMQKVLADGSWSRKIAQLDGQMNILEEQHKSLSTDVKKVSQLKLGFDTMETKQTDLQSTNEKHAAQIQMLLSAQRGQKRSESLTPNAQDTNNSTSRKNTQQLESENVRPNMPHVKPNDSQRFRTTTAQSNVNNPSLKRKQQHVVKKNGITTGGSSGSPNPKKRKTFSGPIIDDSDGEEDYHDAEGAGSE